MKLSKLTKFFNRFILLIGRINLTQNITKGAMRERIRRSLAKGYSISEAFEELCIDKEYYKLVG